MHIKLSCKENDEHIKCKKILIVQDSTLAYYSLVYFFINGYSKICSPDWKKLLNNSSKKFIL